MTTSRGGAAMALAAILCVQLGLAVSVQLFDDIGVQGAAWLRLAWAGVLLLVFVRPSRRGFTRASLLACVALGVTTAAMTMLFMTAVATSAATGIDTASPRRPVTSSPTRWVSRM